MTQIGIRQARQELPALIDRAEAGEDITITRQGKPVAKLVAAPRKAKPLPPLAQFRRSTGRPGVSAARLIRKERDER